MKRVINSFLLTYGHKFSFIQGMTVICTFLLMHMSEVEAFYFFERLITKVFPTYVNPAQRVGNSSGNSAEKGIEGVYAACYLLDQLMKDHDPELFKILSPSKLWAFACKLKCLLIGIQV